MAADFSVVLDELDTTLKSIEAVLDVDKLRQEVAELEQKLAAAVENELNGVIA